MYTNQTAEELELMRCTSEGIFRAQNSIWLKLNCGVVYLLAFLTFILSYKAAKFLKDHNVYSHGSQILLFSTLLTANINQAIFLEIKIRQLIHVLTYSNDPCQIEFHSPDCIYDQTIYSFTNVLSTALGSALTYSLPTLLSIITTGILNQLVWLDIYLQVLFSLIIHLYTYAGISRAGYVPSCQYPPQLSLDTFESVNKATFWFIMANCLLTIVILLLNIQKNNKIKISIFVTKVRYNSFENLLTTKAICSISSTQFAFLSLSTAAVSVISTIEAGISEEVFHLVAQSLTGLVYANLSIPILILFKTNKCIEKRRKSIDKMTNNTNEADYYMSSLRASWEKI
ncbi:hypothetical protein CAEBREN_18505 [Caenorhabditis brenneri]|uniref:Uncharacterized protein n=1 Tax=Caenorhabditis brenneri TaxID=135651 RepID=G0MZR6_CAEBE|nr:hypothetical protein CAEBREN_18505 [Caenorhabditis brenneri]